MRPKAESGEHRSQYGRRLTLVLLIVFLGLMVATYYQVGLQNTRDRLYIEILGQLQVLSQQIAKNAAEAADGLPDAFTLLKTARDSYVANLDVLRNGDPHADLPPLPPELGALLGTLDKLWSGTDKHAVAILNVMQPITTLYENVHEFEAYAIDTVLESDELVNIMVETGASSEQIYMATRQLMLLERIGNNIRASLQGGEGSITAADRFGRDAILFKQVIDGLLNGSEQLGIERVSDPEARDLLDKIAAREAKQSNLINSILESSIELFRIQEASSTIFVNSDGLLAHAKSLLQAYQALTEQRVITETLGNIFGAAALFMLLLVGWQMTREQRRAAEIARLRAEESARSEEDARRREQETRETNRRNQEAILRLLGEISDLADGDLTVTATVSEDFTGAIADAINFSIDEMRGLVRNINRTADQLAVSARSSRETALEMDEASARQVQEIESASEAVIGMANAFKETSESAASSSEVAQNALAIARKGSSAVSDTINGMNAIRENIQETSKRIKRLGESSQEIGDIVGLIDDIADQTNVLALNAAIQASMAGESGRGFAVVADEVQRLAERASQATRQIETLVKTIQADTNDAVISMEKSTSGVVEGAKLSESAGEALGEIEAVSSELAGLVQTISGLSQQHAGQAENVSSSMHSIREVTLRAAAGTRETAEAIGKVAGLAGELQKSVAGFKLPPEDR